MELKIYTTPTCIWSKKLKDWLKKKRIVFQEFDLIENEDAREEIMLRSGQLATPVIEIDHKIIVGFQEKMLEELIKKGKS